MPRLNIDQFEETPNVGDKVKVIGKVKSIDEDSGMVEVSYDDVSIVGKEESKPKYDKEIMPESQSLDDALAESFTKTQ